MKPIIGFVLLCILLLSIIAISGSSVRAESSLSFFTEGCSVWVYCTNGTASTYCQVSSSNSSLVGFPSNLNMNRSEFNYAQSITTTFSSNQLTLVYAFANTTEADSLSDANLTVSDFETAFNTSYAWQSSNSMYGYFFNETYTSPPKQNLTSYAQYIMAHCLAPDLAGFSSTFPYLIQKPNATLIVTATQGTLVSGWTYTVAVSYISPVQGGAGSHTIDLLNLLNVSSIKPSLYSNQGEIMSVLLDIYSGDSVSYVSSEPATSSSYMTRGWVSQSYIPQLITAFFNFGNDTSPVNQLSYTFAGVVVPEFPSYALTIIAFLLAISVLTLLTRPPIKPKSCAGDFST